MAVWQVIGQERALRLLGQALEAGQFAHAYLFSGPPHVGKLTLALDVARALNCEGDSRPRGECEPCRKIAAGSHADVQVIGLVSNDEGKKLTEISIEQIADVQRAASLPPFEGRKRVFIIDGAELLSMEAANRLLKTLEEPEAYVVFILLTSDEKLVPATVISRCQRLELRRMPAAALETALRERWQVPPDKAALLARVSHGRVGWALAAFTDESLLKKREEQLDKLVSLMESGLDERFGAASQMAAHFTQDRGRVQETLGLWLDFWHDLLLVKTGSRDMVANIDGARALDALANLYTLEEIDRFIHGIRACQDELRKNVSAKLALEKLMLDMPLKGGLPVGRT